MSKLLSLQELIDSPVGQREPKKKAGFQLDMSRPMNQNELQKFLFTKNTSRMRKVKEASKAKERKEKKMAIKDEDGKPVFSASTKERRKKVMKTVEKVIAAPFEEERKAKEKLEREEEKKMKREGKKAANKMKREMMKASRDAFVADEKAKKAAEKAAMKAEEKAKKEAEKAAKPKRKARFEKGSPEALAFGQRMKELKAAKKAAAAK